MPHPYDHDLTARAHAGQLLVRSGEDPLEVLAAVVWPSPTAREVLARRADRLWISERGLVACDLHGGHYLREAIGHAPPRERHVTPLDTWVALGPGEIAAEGLACEECAA